MTRNAEFIEDYVAVLLNESLKPAKSDPDHMNYGYAKERKVYEDPRIKGKRVVVVTSGMLDEEGKPTTGKPDPIEEANNYIDNLLRSASFLINNESISADEKNKKMEALKDLGLKFKRQIKDELQGQRFEADLFADPNSEKNKRYIKAVQKTKDNLKIFSTQVAGVSGHSLNELDLAGHMVRSQNRDAFLHRFIPDEKNPNEEHFVLYIPCSRYTKRQQRYMNSSDKNAVERDHDTTSHNRKNLILGNSSMARMVVGVRDARTGQITIAHDSFSGPGARMPYKDFKSADSLKNMAIKSVTLMNQEETIQTIAQRKIDRLSNKELIAAINKVNPAEISNLDIKSSNYRTELIKAYLKTNPLSVTECYTQVITAGQRFASKNQSQQFEYTRQMMDAFNGAEAKVHILLPDGTEVPVQTHFQARMGSWGVNEFRNMPLLSDTSITKMQNARFINQMSDDVVQTLSPFISQNPETGLYDHPYTQTLRNDKILMRYIKGPDVSELTIKINKLEENLKEIKEQYREELFAYFQAYKSYESGTLSRKELEKLKASIDGLEQTIQATEADVYKLHQEIEGQRKAFFLEHESDIDAALSSFKAELLVGGGLDADGTNRRKTLQNYYNSCAYLVDAQKLYYHDVWHRKENNFKLQALMGSLATELDFANTKGCMSNNDRGIRLAQVVTRNALITATGPNGLYGGTLSPESQSMALGNLNPSKLEKIDRFLTTIQQLHHTANTGVSGGKFRGVKMLFTDNGLLKEVASFAKVGGMQASKKLMKNQEILDAVQQVEKEFHHLNQVILRIQVAIVAPGAASDEKIQELKNLRGLAGSIYKALELEFRNKPMGVKELVQLKNTLSQCTEIFSADKAKPKSVMDKLMSCLKNESNRGARAWKAVQRAVEDYDSSYKQNLMKKMGQKVRSYRKQVATVQKLMKEETPPLDPGLGGSKKS